MDRMWRETGQEWIYVAEIRDVMYPRQPGRSPYRRALLSAFGRHRAALLIGVAFLSKFLQEQLHLFELPFTNGGPCLAIVT
jgi:hypothetical protein